jgi:hypothetical protein
LEAAPLEGDVIVVNSMNSYSKGLLLFSIRGVQSTTEGIFEFLWCDTMYVHTDVLENLAASIFRVQEVHLVVGGGVVVVFFSPAPLPLQTDNGTVP